VKLIVTKHGGLCESAIWTGDLVGVSFGILEVVAGRGADVQIATPGFPRVSIDRGRTTLCESGLASSSGVTQAKQPPVNPGRFILPEFT
jgi:hypothetical protein